MTSNASEEGVAFRACSFMSRVRSKNKQIITVYKGNIKSLICATDKIMGEKLRKDEIKKENEKYMAVNMFAKFYI